MEHPSAFPTLRDFLTRMAEKTGTRFLSPSKSMTRQFSLKSAVQKAKLRQDEELSALQRLDAQARQLERVVTGPPVDQLISGERERSPIYGGRSIFGLKRPFVSDDV